MKGSRFVTWERIGAGLLFLWLSTAAYSYLDYLSFVSKLRNAGEEHINVYFVSEVIGNLRPAHDEPVLIVLPSALSNDERWFYHYRIRYRLYPQKIDFAEIIGGSLKKVSYDYRQYKGKLPITIHPSDLLPLKASDYRYVITIAGAKVELPDSMVVTDATDVKGVVYQRVR